MHNKSLEQLLEIDRLMGVQDQFSGTRVGALFQNFSKDRFGEKAPVEKLPYYWNAEHYGFEKVSVYRDLPAAKQELVLKILTNHYLGESCFIEKMGFGFNAKMILLSDSIEERTLYSGFALDEAKHLQMIRRYIHETPTQGYRENPFLALIGTAIQIADRDSLVLFIQVLLEGFGMSHYRWLQEDCLHPTFKAELAELLRDEAYHHGSGSLLASHQRFTPDPKISMELLPKMIQLLHGWTHPHLSALSIASGGLSTDQKSRVLEEMDYAGQTQVKLDQMKALITFPVTRSWIDQLESYGIFKAISPRQCAEFHLDGGAA